MDKNNIISDWLDQYGDPEIDKRVELEAEIINKMIDIEKKEQL